MSQELTLDQLAAEGGDTGEFDVGAAGLRKKLKMEIAYPVQFLSQEISVSQSGYYVAKWKLGVIGADGETTDGDTIVRCLPVFPEDTMKTHDPEKLSQLKQSFGQGFYGILRGIKPEQFSIYKESLKKDGKWKFFDFEGREMSGAEKKQRETMISKAVIGFAKHVAAGDYNLTGSKCYFVWTPNKKDSSNPYSNFWSVAPDKYPLFEG